jgi:hypothetical protein
MGCVYYIIWADDELGFSRWMRRKMFYGVVVVAARLGT